jgi:hypothetical protein
VLNLRSGFTSIAMRRIPLVEQQNSVRGIQYLLALGECCLISILWNLISSEKKLWFKGTNRVEADNGSGFQPIK